MPPPPPWCPKRAQVGDDRRNLGAGARTVCLSPGLLGSLGQKRDSLARTHLPTWTVIDNACLANDSQLCHRPQIILENWEHKFLEGPRKVSKEEAPGGELGSLGHQGQRV